MAAAGVVAAGSPPPFEPSWLYATYPPAPSTATARTAATALLVRPALRGAAVTGRTGSCVSAAIVSAVDAAWAEAPGVPGVLIGVTEPGVADGAAKRPLGAVMLALELESDGIARPAAVAASASALTAAWRLGGRAVGSLRSIQEIDSSTCIGRSATRCDAGVGSSLICLIRISM